MVKLNQGVWPKCEVVEYTWPKDGKVGWFKTEDPPRKGN